MPIENIRSSAEPLRRVDTDTVVELAKSIESNGLLQPILVRPYNGSYEVVFGNHRLEACRRLGWKLIPADVKEVNDEEGFLLRVVENLQRNVTINPLTEARGYIRLIERGWTINSIAKRVGKSDSYISDRVGLIRRLHPDVARRIQENGRIRPSHCEVLARIHSKNSQLELSELIERKGLSVRKLEQLMQNRQLFKAVVKEHRGNLCLQLPERVVESMSIEAGSNVHLYPQSRQRLVIEIISPQPTRAILQVVPTKRTN
jgi:ParB family chromosome partitioning protein